MRMKTRISCRKSTPVGKSRQTKAVVSKLRKKWQFAPDAIGMVSGPSDLSQRKGLSG